MSYRLRNFVIAAVLAVRAYCHWLSPRQRRALGCTASKLVAGPSRVLDQHGFLMTLVVTAITSAAVAALWFSGRPVPGVQIP